jgi:hypothetical protein
MPFTAAEIVTFFTDAANMGLTPRTATAFAAEGIATPADLAEFDKNGMESIFCNLRKPSKVLRAGAAGARGELQEVMAYELSAKLQIRLTIAAKAARFYEDTGRELDPDNMLWSVIKRFDEQFKALMARKVGDSTYIPPKLTKNFSTHKWLESFVLYLRQKVGVRECPLEYVVREVAAVVAVPPPLLAGEPHTEEHGGSIEGDMIARMSHAHTLFKADNGAVFELIETAVRGTAIAASIAPFRRERNGRNAFLAIRAQHAGKDVWDKLVKEAETILQTRKWSGTTNVTLAQHMGKHRQAFITLTECAEHLLVNVPNERSCVTHLIESIQSTDPTVLAALAAVRQDETDKRVNFENSFAYLVVVCPVEATLAKKGKVSFQADISGTSATAAGLGGDAKKPSFGTTGVALQYHKHKDFVKLPKDQKDELSAWQRANSDKNNGGGKRNKSSPGKSDPSKRFKSMISAMETKQNEVMQAMADAQQAGISAMLAGTTHQAAKAVVVGAAVGTSHIADTREVLMERANVAALKLQGILKAKKA